VYEAFSYQRACGIGVGGHQLMRAHKRHVSRAAVRKQRGDETVSPYLQIYMRGLKRLVYEAVRYSCMRP
jgi:hypothetical protein